MVKTPRLFQGWIFKLDCSLVGSLDFNFLVEINGFATKPAESYSLFAEGQQQPSKGC